MADSEKFENVKHSKRIIFVNNFTGGIAWALGATVGLAVIFIALGIIVKNINLVPYVGSFVADVINFVISKNPQLAR